VEYETDFSKDASNQTLVDSKFKKQDFLKFLAIELDPKRKALHKEAHERVVNQRATRGLASVSSLWQSLYDHLSTESERMATVMADKPAAAADAKEKKGDNKDVKKPSVKDRNIRVEAALKAISKERETILNNIFKAHDKNKDGKLDKKEITALTQEVLKVQKGLVPAQVDALISFSVMLATEMAGAQEKEDQKAVDAKLKEIKDSMAQSRTDMIQQLEATFDKLSKDSAGVANELFTAIDTNADGKISQQEFVQGYAKASEGVFSKLAMQ